MIIPIIIGLSAILLWAGLEKLRNPTPLVFTITSLGVTKYFASFFAGLLILSEFTLALFILFFSNSTTTHIGIITLAGIFAFAGLVTIISGKTIKCNCFGVGGTKYLGKAQIFAFPFWVISAGILHFGETRGVSLNSSALLFAIVSLLITGIRGIEVLRLQILSRKDRLSAQEMYLWL